MKKRLLALLRVDERPQLPPGDPGKIDCFRASRRFLHYSVLRWAGKQLGALTALLASLAFFGGFEVPVQTWGLDQVLERLDGIEILVVPLDVGDVRAFEATLLYAFLESVAIAGFVGQLVVSGALLPLAWETRWYMVGEESLRIREGLWHLREQTLTLANVQNVAQQQGPLQRLFGISDLKVYTAGGGGGAEGEAAGSGSGGSRNLHVGILRGLDEPSRIQERLRERLRVERGADPDADAPEAPDAAAARRLAARELLDEVRALRRELTA
ncbi:MAG: PH domain-containing protein [Thermoanaerobaculia bacterium]|nr:PH domain-containing protein [Thermoanaerobaculia bacterium]